MRQFLNTVGAIAVGLGLMYYLDPEQGRLRRALIAHRLRWLTRESRSFSKTPLQRARNRMFGLWANLRYQLAPAPVGDEQLNAQVRSRLGRLVGHPGAIETVVRDGRLRLSGPILADELEALLTELRQLNGVKAIDNQLSPRPDAGREPGLQGSPRPVRHFKRDRAAPWLLAGGALACGLLAPNPRLRSGALSTSAALVALSLYRKQQRARATGFERSRRDAAAPLDYRPFVDASDAELEVGQVRS